MFTASKGKLAELQAVISKMSLEVCCTAVLPELGLRWNEVSAKIRDSRLPVTSASAARVLGRHIARSVPAEEYDNLLSRLRLKLIATQQRTWHLISLSEPVSEEPTMQAQALPGRVRQALHRSSKKDVTALVESVNMGDLVFLSVQLGSAGKRGAPLLAAAPPGRPIALVSSLTSKQLIKATVEGLGYKCYEDESLHGCDIPSLLRIYDRRWNVDNVELLNGVPEYQPTPVLTENGIDFTNKAYNEEYVNKLFGPDPPLLTNLKIQTSKPFFDPSKMQKNINLTVEFKCENVAQTLKDCVKQGALAPDSPILEIFHQMQSNSVAYEPDD